MSFPVGKLPAPMLARLLAHWRDHLNDPRVVVGPHVGEDAAVLDFGESCLVVATDPITLASDMLGWYAVHVNANDVAVRGAMPRWFSAVLLLPEDRTDEAPVAALFGQIYDACAEVGCTLIGGHTEITTGLRRPLLIGQMIGEVLRDKLVTTAGAKVGDGLLLIKGIAIEGTAILARQKADQLRERGVPADLLRQAQGFLFEPGLSVVREALAVNSAVSVHAMHDPTEGGLATALLEMAESSQVGVLVDRAVIPVLPECETICAALGLDPLGLLASGALLVALAPPEVERVIPLLAGDGIACTQIGRIVSGEQGSWIRTNQGTRELLGFPRDEITRVL